MQRATRGKLVLLLVVLFPLTHGDDCNSYTASQLMCPCHLCFPPLGLHVTFGASQLRAEDEPYPHSQFDDLNCSNFTVAQLKAVNLTRSITAAVSLAIVALILLFLVLYKAYKSTLQRLFVHLTIVTSLHDVSFVLEVEHQFEYRGQKQFCAFLGFLDQWTATLVYLFIHGITFFLLYTIYKQLKGDPFPNYRRLKVILEVFFTFMMIFLPLAYLWLPFTTDTYGLGSGAVCWMKSVEKNCETIRPFSKVAYAIAVLMITVCIVHILSTFGLAVVFCKLAYTYKGMKHRHIKTVKDTFILMCFLLTSVVFDCTTLLWTVNFGKRISERYSFWIFTAVGPPISMLIYPIGFLFYLYSFKKFRWHSIKRAAAEWKASCGRKGEQRHVHFRPRVAYNIAPTTKDLATAPGSHPAFIPSTTFFNVEHTGGFTDITEEEQPLVSHSDTGYGSGIRVYAEH